MVRPEREFTARSNQAGRYQRSLRGRTVRSDQRRHQSDQIDPHDHHHADYGDPVLPERLCGKTPLAYAAALQFGPARHVEHGPSPCAEQAGHDRQRRNLVIQRSAPAGGEPGPASQEHRQKCDPHHQTQAAHAPPSRHKLRQPREYGGNKPVRLAQVRRTDEDWPQSGRRLYRTNRCRGQSYRIRGSTTA